MFYKNIKSFLRKYFLFLIPFLLLIFYFLSPIPGAVFKSSSQTINQKEREDEIIASYKYAISPEGIKQCSEECLDDATRRDRSLYLCKDRCRRKVFSPDKMSPEEIERCNQKCEEPDELLSECAYHYCRNIGGSVYEIQQSSFTRLFFQNLKKEFVASYQSLIKIFHFQNLIIIFLVLILYYGITFGINIIKRLERQK